MDAFIDHLLHYSASLCPILIQPRGIRPVDAGVLSLCIAGEDRELPLAPLFMEYDRLHEADRSKFLHHIFMQYIVRGEERKLFGTAKAGLFSEKKEKLMPLLVTDGWIQKKSQVLPKDVHVPTLTLGGQEGTSDGLALCVIIDCGVGFSVVLSSYLQAWDAELQGVMHTATINLQSRTNLANCWLYHPSGCVVSKWCDGYDATRAILMPHLVDVEARQMLTFPISEEEEEETETLSDAEADMVAIFPIHNQLIAAKSNNPIALCFMGQVLFDLSDFPQSDVLSQTAFRLTTSESCGLLRGFDDPSRHLHWVPYIPGHGEYCVPHCIEECKAIMIGAHCGKAPVFYHGQEVFASCSTNDALKHPNVQTSHYGGSAKGNEAAEQEREKGNLCFKEKQWEEALQHYTAAITLAPDHSKLVPMCNRAAVWLELDRYAEALADCNEVLSWQPQHFKALYRRGCAHQSLHNYSLAMRDFEMLRELDPGSRKAAASQISKTIQLQIQWQVCQWTSQVIAIMLQPKGHEAIPGLLTKAVGWSPIDAADGRPGWMPKAFRDSIGARVAALELYSMLRDEWVTAKDAAVQSAYALLTDEPLPPRAFGRDRAAVELAASHGVHSFIILGIINQHLFGQGDPYQIPLESRSLCQIVACITHFPEIKFLVACSLESLQQAGALSQLMTYTPGQFQCI